MKINYDVAYDDPVHGPVQFLDGSFDSKKQALRALAKQRHRHPDAYLVRFQMTRCQEVSAKNAARTVVKTLIGCEFVS